MTFEEEMEALKKNLSAKRADLQSRGGMNFKREAENHKCRLGMKSSMVRRGCDVGSRDEEEE